MLSFSVEYRRVGVQLPQIHFDRTPLLRHSDDGGDVHDPLGVSFVDGVRSSNRNKRNILTKNSNVRRTSRIVR